MTKTNFSQASAEELAEAGCTLVSRRVVCDQGGRVIGYIVKFYTLLRPGVYEERLVLARSEERGSGGTNKPRRDRIRRSNITLLHFIKLLKWFESL
jgi:hypothetical protein